MCFDDALQIYDSDLPNSVLLSTEVWRWRTKWQKENATDRPSTLELALKHCDREYFPNLHSLLCIMCTLPVTSCENERANSVLKNLKTYLRNMIGQEKMAALAFNENTL